MYGQHGSVSVRETEEEGLEESTELPTGNSVCHTPAIPALGGGGWRIVSSVSSSSTEKFKASLGYR